jgi:hypothetical protein
MAKPIFVRPGKWGKSRRAITRNFDLDAQHLRHLGTRSKKFEGFFAENHSRAFSTGWMFSAPRSRAPDRRKWGKSQRGIGAVIETRRIKNAVRVEIARARGGLHVVTGFWFFRNLNCDANRWWCHLWQ